MVQARFVEAGKFEAWRASARDSAQPNPRCAEAHPTKADAGTGFLYREGRGTTPHDKRRRNMCRCERRSPEGLCDFADTTYLVAGTGASAAAVSRFKSALMRTALAS